MSVREDIAKDIVQALQGITDPNVVLVSRNPIDISDLSIAQYPAIIVRTAEEDREDAAFGSAGEGLGQLITAYKVMLGRRAQLPV